MILSRTRTILVDFRTDSYSSDVRAFESYGADYHADHSFEVNPPSYTILRFVRHPPTGGDTLFTSQAKLFDALSPAFQQALSGLTAIHSSEVSLFSIL